MVGAGPVGLLMALLLHHEGVKATIIERQPKLYPLPRAVCLDNESQRLLWNAGLEESLQPWLELESNGLNFTWRDREKKPLVSMDWDKPGPTGGHTLLLHSAGSYGKHRLSPSLWFQSAAVGRLYRKGGPSSGPRSQARLW